jgi:hypothetical protein
MGDHPSRTPGAHQIAHRVEERSPRVIARRGVLFHPGQAGRAKRPCLLGDSAWIVGLVTSRFVGHPKRHARLSLQITAFSEQKSMTRSMSQKTLSPSPNGFAGGFTLGKQALLATRLSIQA